MRTIPAGLLSAMNAPTYNGALLTFLTISHPDITTIHLVDNEVAVARGGVLYLTLGAESKLPGEQGDGVGNATLAIDAVDLTAITALRTVSLSSFVLVNIVLALGATPDTDYLDMGTYKWRNVTWNKDVASGDLSFDDDLDLIIPGDDLSPVNNPGAF